MHYNCNYSESINMRAILLSDIIVYYVDNR